jgi:hypothetical protein
MKNALIFRPLIGFALLRAASFALLLSIGGQMQGATAFPEIISVNTTFDATSGADDAFPGDGQCETAVGDGVCTLRARY